MAELLAANQITIAKVLDGEQGIPGEPGADGKTSYFHIKYSAVANPTSSSEISETPLAYIGTYVDFTEADSTDPTKYTWSRFEGIQGEKGEQGIPGIGQDGRTSYLHIAYATSADGSEGFSISESANKTYIGQYTDFVSTDSTDYTKYAWTKIKGEMSAEQLAQLNQASEDASQAKTDVANLEIGGRNLLIGSEKGVVNTNADTKLTANIKFQAYNGSTYIGLEFMFVVTAGEHIEYTYTSKYSCDRVKIGHNGSAYDAVETFLVPEYKEGVVYTFSCDVIDDRPNVVGGYVLKNIKLEKGNKATDWTPAPEDVDAGINNAAKVATNYIHYDGTNGLVLGNKESGSWVGYRTQIDNDSFNVLDENGNIIASYGSNEVELGKGNPNAIIKMCDGKAYVKNYIVGSQNTSVFCGQDVTVVGEWEGASESYALFKQGFASIGQSSSYIRFSNETDNNNYIEIQGQNITMRRVTNVGDFNCYMDANFKGSVTIATPLPISSGGTGATTAAAARTNLGLTGAETKTLLWTNASPTSDFAAQTVLDNPTGQLSGYDAVEIVSRFTTSNIGQTVEKCEVGSRVFVEKFYNATSTSAHAAIMHRQIDVSSNGVIFADAKSKVTDENTSTTNNSVLIPYKIYGIKVV